MILPITGYGHNSLRATTVEITKDYEGLSTLIENMFETMYKSNGVGLAAPQVDLAIRLFVIDTAPFEESTGEKGVKKVVINPRIVEEFGDDFVFEEGCLSVPDIHENVVRKSKIRIQYYDENFEYHDEEIDGMQARVMQHEYDHLEGHTFIDRLSSLKKMVLKRRLNDIVEGRVHPAYKMKFAHK